MGSDGNAFRAIPRWIRLVMGFQKMPKLRMSIHFSVTKSTLKLCSITSSSTKCSNLITCFCNRVNCNRIPSKIIFYCNKNPILKLELRVNCNNKQ